MKEAIRVEARHLMEEAIRVEAPYLMEEPIRVEARYLRLRSLQPQQLQIIEEFAARQSLLASALPPASKDDKGRVAHGCGRVSCTRR
jgi:hypothetical protein